MVDRQCLGPPHAARAIIVSFLEQGVHLEVRTHADQSTTTLTHQQDAEFVAPSMHPVSLTFSSSEAERRFRVQHNRAATRRDTVLDAVFAALYFALLVPCLDKWGMDANPAAPSTIPYRLTSLASSLFVLLGIGPMMLAAAQLDWVGAHRTVLRYACTRRCTCTSAPTQISCACTARGVDAFSSAARAVRRTMQRQHGVVRHAA